MRAKRVYLAVLGLAVLTILAVVFGSLGGAGRGDGREEAMNPQETGKPMNSEHQEDWLLEPLYKVNSHKDLVYATKENEHGRQESLALDIYEPLQEEAASRPLILFIHGGGFNSGDKRDAEAIAEEWVSRGYVVASANYRLRVSPQADMKGTIADAIEDMGDALAWLKDNQESYRIDTRYTAVGGDSAGGQLAVTFASRYKAVEEEDAPRLFAVIDIYGPLFRGEITENYPSTLIIHGTEDQLVPYEQSVRLFDMLGAANVYRQLVTMEGGGHSYQDPKVWEQVVQSTTHFLRNAITASQQIFLPEDTELGAFAGEYAQLQLLRQAFFVETSGQLQAKLPKGWELVGQTAFSSGENAEVQVAIPEDAASGVYPVRIGTDQSGSLPLTLYIKVKDRLSYERTVFYNAGEQQLHTNLSIKNSYPTALQGKVTIRYQDSEGSRVESYELKSIQPGAVKKLTMPFYSEEAPVVVYENSAGAVLQETSLMTYVYAAEKRTGPLTIDGSLEDWRRDYPFPLNGESQLHMKEYAGADDLSGQGYVAWDEEYVYLALEMKDDRHVQQETAFGIYMGDSVQFSLRLVDQSGTPQGVHEFGVALHENGSPANFRWLAPPEFRPGKVHAMKTGISRSNDQTVYEIALPWAELGVAAPTEGMHLKFSLLVNDNDGQGRKGWIEYNSGIGYKDANAFGDLFLVNKRN
ncbi:alpha/beta hydrolase fold domain-containing protein [Paenibacillus paeoniae]|uniref:Alpha/beta hydrolase n=1 Tax=Paenibacillus paeoniae TaxID=2292705 RepID=A0A371PGT9_9BACL|nr:alpha/beta hydrolase fold domain-containing protein [Paenibacillus paeoniae]REK75064.1 hypothetical protein DX130_15630 [Paenibacillus paeoniae]